MIIVMIMLFLFQFSDMSNSEPQILLITSKNLLPHYSNLKLVKLSKYPHLLPLTIFTNLFYPILSDKSSSKLTSLDINPI